MSFYSIIILHIHLNDQQACGCSCLLYCLPDSCACALQGIKCQVSRMILVVMKMMKY